MQIIKQWSYITTGYLNLGNLSKVQKSIWEAHGKWYNLGLELGITPTSLDSIGLANPQKPEDCFRAMLSQWLRKHQATWRALAEALSSPPVGYGLLAEQIQLESERCDSAQWQRIIKMM